MINGLLRGFFRQVIAIYFRSIEFVGDTPDKDTTRCVFVSNHFNGIIDPMLVLTQVPAPISPIAKSTLWKIPGLRWLLNTAQAVPVQRRKDDPNQVAGANDAIFDAVGSHLARGGNILIFPEGVSHSEPYVLPLKTGAARMILNALDKKSEGLSFQAIGLEFEARELFRSRVLVLFGPRRQVDAIEGEGEDKVKAIQAQMHADLKELIVEGDSWDEKVAMLHIATMFANEEQDERFARHNEIGRWIEQTKETLKRQAPERYTHIILLVAKYFSILAQRNISDKDVKYSEEKPLRRRSVFRTIGIFVFMPVALLGMSLYVIPYQLPRWIAKRRAHNQPDEISTYKLAVGLLVFPGWFAILAVTSCIFMPFKYWAMSMIFQFIAPFSALVTSEWLSEVRIGNKDALLYAQRKQIVAELEEVRRLIIQ